MLWTDIRDPGLRDAIERLPEDKREALTRAGELVYKRDPYYSRIRFSPTASGAGPYTWTLSAGTVISAFSYGRGDALGASQGFNPAGSFTARACDTNLLAKQETNGSEFMFIRSIQCMLLPQTETEVARRVLSEVSVQLSMEGKSGMYVFGPPFLLPGGAGLYGGAQSRMIEAPQDQAFLQTNGYLANGFPGVLDVRRQEGDPILWMPKGNRDSSLQIDFRVERDVSWTNAAARVAGAGISAFTPPSATYADGTYVDMLVVLDGVQLAPRSSNR